MLMWLLIGLGAAASFAFIVIRDAEAHDKRTNSKAKRKVTPKESD